MSRTVNTTVYGYVINNSTVAPVECAIGVVPASEYPCTLANLRRFPGAVFRTAAYKGGMDRQFIRKSASTNQHLGVSALTERGYQQNYAEATATTALITDTPVLELVVSTPTGTDVACYIDFTVEYDVEFFELQVPGV